MTNLDLSQNLHQHASDLEDRLAYYNTKGEPEAVAILAEQAHAVRLRYLKTFGTAMTEGMESKWTKTA